MNPIVFFCLIGAALALPYSGIHVADGVVYTAGDGPFLRTGLVPESYKTGDVDYPTNHYDKFFKPSPFVFKRDYKYTVSGYDPSLTVKPYADLFEYPYNLAGLL